MNSKRMSRRRLIMDKQIRRRDTKARASWVASWITSATNLTHIPIPKYKISEGVAKTLAEL